MVRPQKHFIYLWEEQKKYTNRSKIRLELEAFISEQRPWSLVPWKVEEEKEAAAKSEVKEEAECCDMTSMVEYLVRLIYEETICSIKCSH